MRNVKTRSDKEEAKGIYAWKWFLVNNKVYLILDYKLIENPHLSFCFPAFPQDIFHAFFPFYLLTIF